MDHSMMGAMLVGWLLGAPLILALIDRFRT
jgi:hypothetical protein